MSRCLLVLVLSSAFVSCLASDFIEESTLSPSQESLESSESNNIFGVASIAGITSRNGRVSSLGGIQIYPNFDSAPIALTNDGANFFYTIPKTKDTENKYATGSIELLPGSVIVSSTSRSGFAPDIKAVPLNINNKPREFFFQPIPELLERARNFDSMDPWFLRNMLAFTPQKPEGINNAWLYPNFNPFLNFWR